MKDKKLTMDSIVKSSIDAKAIFFNKSGIEIDFYPVIINFYIHSKKITSLCWKGTRQDLDHDIIISALGSPIDDIQNPEKIEYIPLNNDDTIIIGNKIFSIKKEEENENFHFIESPFVFSEKLAISIANNLTGADTSNYFWRIYEGAHNNNPICYMWIGVCIEDYNKSVTLPVFAENQNFDLVDDITPLSISDIITYNGSIYQIYQNDFYFELKYLSTITQSPSS